MRKTYKVRLVSVPDLTRGTCALAIKVRGKIRIARNSVIRFATRWDLKRACQKANVPLLLSDFPAPNIDHDLTREQIATLGFELCDIQE